VRRLGWMLAAGVCFLGGSAPAQQVMCSTNGPNTLWSRIGAPPPPQPAAPAWNQYVPSGGGDTGSVLGTIAYFKKLALQKRVGKLMADGDCLDARNEALKAGNLRMARQVDEVCRQAVLAPVAQPRQPAAVATIPTSAVLADPLAGARNGKIECTNFDVMQRTCGAMTSFLWSPNGTITRRSQLRIPGPNKDTKAVMDVSVSVESRGSSLCSTLHDEDVDRAEFTINGTVATPQDAERLRSSIKDGLRTFIGVDVCTSYTVEGDKLVAHAFANGQDAPNLTRTVLWVPAQDGWHLAH
jgi:hypothetical protein